MDFSLTKEQQAFQQEVCGFLTRELPADWMERGVLDVESAQSDSFFRSMARKLGWKGWLSLTWPKEYGGQACTQIEQLILSEEIAYHGGNEAPGVNIMGCKMLAPTLLLYGTEEQKKQHLPGIAKGEVMWCEGFSEPGAGSDLASLQLRAVEKEGCYVIDGQKTFISHAHRADWCFFLARTDPEAVPKHRGISFFLVDLKNTSDITIRPLINLANVHSFNEVFFDGVRIPKENMVGEKNRGWRVALVVLNFERSGIERPAWGRRLFEQLVQYAKETKRGGIPLARDPIIRYELAELAIETEISRLFCYRVAWLQNQGLVPTYEASVSRVYGAELVQRITRVGLQIMGLYGQLEPVSKWAPLAGLMEREYLHCLALTIAAGTSEVQRNIIAIRGFGLPR